MDNKQRWLGRLFGHRPLRASSAEPPLTVQATDPAHQDNRSHIPSQEAPPVVSPLSVEASSVASVDAEAAVPIVWQIGTILLDQYEVKGELGEGGMGKVYQVHHRDWNIDLAVKSPRPEIFTEMEGKENFEREAETWVNLGLHPHIVGCYYVRTLGGIPRIFAEYVAGGSLSAWIETRRLYAGDQQQALARILDVAIQFAWGLHYAHEQGLVHQDVKPANVMMTLDGTVKVTDFGLAQARKMTGEMTGPEQAGRSIVVPGIGLMTRAYASPEQIRGQPLTRKTDIWSWGVSVLEMFVGEVLWRTGAVAQEVLASHEAQDAVIPVMPAAVVTLLARCFQPRPEARPATMLEVAQALQTIFQQHTGHPYPRDIPTSAQALADTLNNRALSLYDLGKVKEAQQVWEQALLVDPQYFKAAYNRGVVRWRRGELTDDALVYQLSSIQVPPDERSEAVYLLAYVHLERGEVAAALPLLQEAVQQGSAEMDAQLLLDQVQSVKITSGYYRRAFQGHTSWVESVSLSADGRLALSASRDKTMRVWDLMMGLGGRCLRVLQGVGSTRVSEVSINKKGKAVFSNVNIEGHTRTICSVSMSADGSLALSGSEDRTVRVWDLRTGKCLRVLEGHTDGVHAVSVSANGYLALSASHDQTVRVWEVATGRCLRILQGHAGSVYAVSISADNRLVLSGGQDQTVRVWEPGEGRCLRVLEGHTSGVSSVSVSADGRLALSGSWDQTVRVWEVATGHCLHILRGHKEIVTSVSLSADGRLALSGSRDGAMRMWDVRTGRCLRTFEEHTDVVTSVNLSADGRLALSGSRDETVHLWEVPRHRFFCPLRLSKVRSHTDIAHIESRVELLLDQVEQSWGEHHIARTLSLLREVRELPGWERVPKSLEAWWRLSLQCRKVSFHAGWFAKAFQGHTEGVTSVSLSADGQLALSGSYDRTMRVWNVWTGDCQRVLQGHIHPVTVVNLSANGRFALSGSGDQTIRLWDLRTGDCLHILRGHTSIVTSANFSADGRFILSGGDQTVRLWEVQPGRCLRVFKGHTDTVDTVSLSTDGRFALSGSWDQTVRVWDVRTGHCLRVLKGHTELVSAVSLNADGRLALSGSGDQTIRLWDVRTGHCLRIFEGHTDTIASVSLSADGRWVLSGSGDQTMRLWDVRTGHCLRVLQGHTDRMTSLSMSADNRFILSGNLDQTVRLWELDWELEAPEPTTWNEEALPFLETFLMQHTPYARKVPQDREPSEEEIQQALTRHGQPIWTEPDFQELLRHLQYVGYGWLQPDGVRKKLESLASHWGGVV